MQTGSTTTDGAACTRLASALLRLSHQSSVITTRQKAGMSAQSTSWRPGCHHLPPAAACLFLASVGGLVGDLVASSDAEMETTI